MRDLIFKNLTSLEKKRKILATSEIVDKQGVRSIIRRHFIYIVKEIKGSPEVKRPLPYVYVLKERNNRLQEEKFFCRMKGSVFTVCNGRLFLILYMHSLKITLIAMSQDLMRHNLGNRF